MTPEPLYACATRNENGDLVITHEQGRESQFKVHYVIPASSSKQTMKRHGAIITQGSRLEHTLIDIAPLVQAGVISVANVLNLDVKNSNENPYPDKNEELIFKNSKNILPPSYGNKDF